MGITNPKDIEEFAQWAYEKGLDKTKVKDGMIKTFLEQKEENFNGRVVLYCGYVLIFKGAKPKLLTLYQIPNELIKEYIEYD